MIIVTGFMGSGTSPVTKGLHKLGIRFPGPYTTIPNWENLASRAVNEKFLKDQTGYDWQRLPDFGTVASCVEKNFMGFFPDINWKDPRACLTLPIWAGKVTKVVWVRRKRENAIKTNMRVRKLSEEEARKLCNGYESMLVQFLKLMKVPFVATFYEEWYKEKSEREIRRVAQFCDSALIIPRGRIMRVVRELRMPRNF